MIDVVFLLLIYFMAATEFQTSEAAFPIDLPERSHQSILMPSDNPLTIFVESTGKGSLDCRFRIDGPWLGTYSSKSLHEFLKKHHPESENADILFSKEQQFLIRPDKVARWEHVLQAYNAVASSGYINLTLVKPTE
tara:strand:+ start:74 stop:481 length:408 start_codon:yes stop_codon:yes gene_type:complete